FLVFSWPELEYTMFIFFMQVLFSKKKSSRSIQTSIQIVSSIYNIRSLQQEQLYDLNHQRVKPN
ncbi:hypothetical protein, partial [Paenibacillus illinoisensis]|uniref:hypothetical protein n=1 Tax=Paenibacillus illinoisensis TaxID=59845 RepID=UPI001C64BEDD